MARATIQLSDGVFGQIREHLLPGGGVCEEAAFLFARAQAGPDGLMLAVIGTTLIAPEGFTSQSRFYLELTEETRAAVIKRAHDLGAGMIECHSHPGQRGACFSWSDLHGFDEFVPHVMWRLKGRPYAAIVFAADSVDALCWPGPGAAAEALGGLITERGTIKPTGLTFGNWSEIYERQPV